MSCKNFIWKRISFSIWFGRTHIKVSTLIKIFNLTPTPDPIYSEPFGMDPKQSAYPCEPWTSPKWKNTLFFYIPTSASYSFHIRGGGPSVSLVVVLILFMISTFVICHSSLVEKALCYQITFFMEFPVDFIDIE